jgi:hypothetical protein
MKHRYPTITFAVATALACNYASATPPTIAQAANPVASLVIAGSSSMLGEFDYYIKNVLCGGFSGLGNTLVVRSSGNRNFFAYSCFTTLNIPATSNGSLQFPQIPSPSLITIYYRAEGDSIVGVLPIVTGKQIKRLNLSDPSCTSSGVNGTCAVTGVAATNGPNDSWAGAVVNDTVQLGVSDVEPSLLTGLNYPANYAVSIFGSASRSQLAALQTFKMFQQVFGVAVNTSGLSLATPGVVNLTKQSFANILFGRYTDWSAVPDALTGKPVSSTPA